MGGTLTLAGRMCIRCFSADLIITIVLGTPLALLWCPSNAPSVEWICLFTPSINMTFPRHSCYSLDIFSSLGQSLNSGDDVKMPVDESDQVVWQQHSYYMLHKLLLMPFLSPIDLRSRSAAISTLKWLTSHLACIHIKCNLLITHHSKSFKINNK